MADQEHTSGIEALANEQRTFPPSDAFKASTLVAGTQLYDEAAEDDEAFWARQASELVHWDTEWDTTLDWQLPYAKWFEGGTLTQKATCVK